MEQVARMQAGQIAVNQLTRTTGYTNHSLEVTSIGDLTRMLKVPEGKRLYEPETVTIHPVQTSDGKPWASDPEAEILLLGDSFSNIYSGEDLGWGTLVGNWWWWDGLEFHCL